MTELFLTWFIFTNPFNNIAEIQSSSPLLHPPPLVLISRNGTEYLTVCVKKNPMDIPVIFHSYSTPYSSEMMNIAYWNTCIP